MNYQSFLESKKHILGNFGFKSNYIPRCAFDFQEYVIEKSVEKGRLANFLDTGLGKTLIQLSIAPKTKPVSYTHLTLPTILRV